jgi:biotin carboxyl carrier protein
VQFDLEIGGRLRRVRIEPLDGRYRVAVDDRSFEVDPRRAGRDAMSLLVQEGDGPVTSVDAIVASRPGSAALEVTLGGQTLPATIVTRFGGRRGDGGGAASGGPQQVTAPMPGKVVRVLVSPGETVEPRQGLVVIEAMKMENELRASRAGRVSAVRVAQGQSVEAGALLVIVE